MQTYFLYQDGKSRYESCQAKVYYGPKDRKPNIITSLELKPEAMEINNLRFQAKYREIEENEVRVEEINRCV